MNVVFSNMAKTQVQRRMAEYVRILAGLLKKEFDELACKYGLVIEHEIPQDLKVLSQKIPTINAEVQDRRGLLCIDINQYLVAEKINSLHKSSKTKELNLLIKVATPSSAFKRKFNK